MNLAILSILGASLAGSIHCAAMCGGFACFSAAGSNGSTAMRAHVAYNGGRLMSYLALGALAGFVGSGIDDLGVLVGIARGATIVAGILMVAWGTSTVLAARGVTLANARAPEAWQRVIGGVLQRVQRFPVQQRALLTGFATTLLPCGWLYVFVVAAAGTGAVRDGMLLMSIFWLGTLPAMLAVAAGSRRLLGPLARRMPVVAALIVMIVGLFTLTGRVWLQPSIDNSHVAHAGQHGALK